MFCNGINVKDFDRQEYYKLFSVVFQDFYLPVTASHPFSQFSHLGIRNGARVETTGLQIFPTDQGNGIETFVESLQEILLLRRQ